MPSGLVYVPSMWGLKYWPSEYFKNLLKANFMKEWLKNGWLLCTLVFRSDQPPHSLSWVETFSEADFFKTRFWTQKKFFIWQHQLLSTNTDLQGWVNARRCYGIYVESRMIRTRLTICWVLPVSHSLFAQDKTRTDHIWGMWCFSRSQSHSAFSSLSRMHRSLFRTCTVKTNFKTKVSRKSK